ncbi:MAG: zinc-ribbon domain-containing protein [Candidatus Odinarchaeota archaeon]
MEIKGYIILKGNIYPAAEILKAIANNPHIKISLTSSGELVIDNYKINKLNEPLPNIVRNLLCFKGLSYCCSLDKPCSNRDLALELLGISKKTYKELKEELERKILETLQPSNISEETVPVKDIFYSRSGSRDSLEDWDFSPLSKPENPYESIKPDMERVEKEASSFFSALSGETPAGKQKEMYCKRCGRSIDAFTRFCPNCGLPV